MTWAEHGWMVPVALGFIVAWLDGNNRARKAHIEALNRHLDFLKGMCAADDARHPTLD